MNHSDYTGGNCSCRHDDYCAEGIQSGLNTILFGKHHLYFYDETDSTNDRAVVLAEHHRPEGTVVIAESQSRGRGQVNREWYSPRGAGIYLSLILRPSVPPRDALQVTLLSAVAVAETIMLLTGLDVRIKWPNDIMVNGKKIAGVLTEMDAKMNSVNYMIVGVGINVAMREEMFPDAVRNIATSVLMESGRLMPRSRMVRTFLEKFELGYEAFMAGEPDGILARWRDLAEIMGRRIRIGRGASVMTGVVQYIDLRGSLYLRDDSGAIRRIRSGDICSC